MTDKKEPVVDMLWLLKGEEDPFKNYLDRPREELPMASFSDDALANAIFMQGDISKEEDMRMMLEAMRTGRKHYSKIGILTAGKERMRWLTRRLAVAEGRYPGREVEALSVVMSVMGDKSVEGRKSFVDQVRQLLLLSGGPTSMEGEEPAYFHSDRAVNAEGVVTRNKHGLSGVMKETEERFPGLSDAVRTYPESEKFGEPDYNNPTNWFETVDEAREVLAGKGLDLSSFKAPEGERHYHLDGIYSTRVLEALLYLRRRADDPTTKVPVLSESPRELPTRSRGETEAYPYGENIYRPRQEETSLAKFFREMEHIPDDLPISPRPPVVLLGAGQCHMGLSQLPGVWAGGHPMVVSPRTVGPFDDHDGDTLDLQGRRKKPMRNLVQDYSGWAKSPMGKLLARGEKLNHGLPLGALSGYTLNEPNTSRPLLSKGESWVGEAMVSNGFVIHESVRESDGKHFITQCTLHGTILHKLEKN